MPCQKEKPPPHDSRPLVMGISLHLHLNQQEALGNLADYLSGYEQKNHRMITFVNGIQGGVPHEVF